MILQKNVLLLKSQKGDNQNDKYETLLLENGFSVKHCRTLVFNFKNLDNLRNYLENQAKYEGIIFSSPRCVQAVHLAVNEKQAILTPWESKHNFVVGEMTYKDALEKLKLSCIGKETGNAKKLSEVIIKGKIEYQKPFLFPHGNLKTDTLAKELGQYGIAIEEVLAYDTIANPDIEKEIAGITNNYENIPEYLVFFSPSGVNSSINFLKKVPNFYNVKLIALGPTTELAMREQDLQIYGVSKNPTPDDVLNILLK